MFNFDNENFSKRAKQFGKGALLFLTGAAGYFGFNAAFRKRGELQNDSLAMEAKGNLVNNLVSDSVGVTSFDNSIESLSIKSLIQTSENRRAVSENCDEFRVNTYTTGSQDYPSVASLGDSGFVITWVSYGQDEDSGGIYGQRYNLDGVNQGSEFQVNTYTTGSQEQPSVASLGANGFVVVWQSYGQDGDSWGVYGQRYDLDGVKQYGEFQVNTYTTGHQEYPSIAGLRDNGFVVIWHSGYSSGSEQDGDSYGIYGQRFDLNGTRIGSEFQVNTYTTSYQLHPSVASLEDNGFVVTWQSDEQDGDSTGIYGQRYNLAGVKEDSEFQVNTYTTSYQDHPSVASLGTNGFVVTWHSWPQDVGTYGIYGQRYNLAGVKEGSEFKINTYITGFQGSSSVANLGINGFMVIWESLDQDGGGGLYPYNGGIYGQKFDLIGTKAGNEFLVNTYTTNGQSIPAVANLENNGFVVVWQSDGQDGDNYGIYGLISMPCIMTNSLTISEGQTVVLTDATLSATDVDDDDNTLTFIVNNLQHGQFERVSNQGFAITSFTQQEIINGGIQFVHDGEEIAPSYEIKVSDGQYETNYKAAAIDFSNVNDIPIVINNKLTLYNDQITVFTNNELSATDVEDNDALIEFTVNNVFNGRFERIANPGFGITTFTQQEIVNGDIQFVHTGGIVAPSYEIKAIDGQGGETNFITATITFTIRPEIINNQFSINEGETIVLTNTMLSATDIDDDDATLIFTVDNVQYGQFEQVTNQGIAITSFTQQEIINGDIQFVHDGGEDAPLFDIKVGDGKVETNYIAASITFSNVNDVPVLLKNQFTINEGETVILTSAMLNATDVENNDATLIFTIANVQNGQFEKVSNAGVAITIFTQQEIINGDIHFVHDGGELEPSFNIKVSDGEDETTYTAAVITFNKVNDIPELKNHQLIVNEGQTVKITSTMLSATDVDNDDATLIFTVNNVQNGRFELVANQGFAITSFTQQEITNGNIQFVHDGGEEAPSFDVKVSDGIAETAYTAGSITFSNINDTPTLLNNQFTINEGEAVILTSAMLNAIDIESDDATLSFTVANVKNGQFEKVSVAGVAITSFTQQEITDSQIQFIHDGGELKPSFDIKVSDGELETAYQSAMINYVSINDQTPILVNNQLTINEGQTVKLTSAVLSATDVDNNDATLIFTVSDVQYGRFEQVTNQGVAIISFTQQEIINGDIQFVHDGGEEAPSFEVKVSDEELETSYIAATIVFNNVNDAPELGNNQLTIKDGKKVVLTTRMLSATDVDNDDESLIFTVNNVKNGWFERVDDHGVGITSFTQREVIDEEIRFVHDDSNLKPTYEVKVSDGELESSYQEASITFFPSKKDKLLPLGGIIGGSVGGAAALCALLLSVSCSAVGLGLYATKKRKQLAQERRRNIELEESPFDVGAFLNEYKINPNNIEMGNLLGTGGQASVYKATWEERAIAYKIFKTIDENDVKEFEEEAKIMLKSNHPSIVRLYGICLRQGSFGLLMEFMKMGSLKSALKRQEIKLDWYDKWNIAYDIASALKFLHGKGIVHRDIKTDNVLLYKEEGEIHAKVADFGLSKTQKATDESATMTIGTFKYMAPEMAIGSGNHDAGHFAIEPIDIYALGMTFVALITEKEPYPETKNNHSIPLLIKQGDLKQILPKNKCSQMFFRLTNQCRSIEVELRPTAKQVVDELKGMKKAMVMFKLEEDDKSNDDSELTTDDVILVESHTDDDTESSYTGDDESTVDVEVETTESEDAEGEENSSSLELK